ncbi:hypothetical protein G3N55_07760 [Dissulfurirhabdus thermomarina]|uniref:YkgJ family cysteine cluster protein n=1 Tax=Dissulfurirhabdus thermomarina TaxID=1765737 RepID=A0A6N9TNA5_DISTH|nr:YkgJ family cysteine cluster protein [Dissulfurirhabdus thermomarina]NDY42735.1 hypothetical protein [Dissulfurirhabdus thermomarina]NMX22558.1 hypothetical protein [Dissulfurirhabdus thermomarina]
MTTGADNAAALRAVYAFHQEFLEGWGFACEAGCAACCTVNVTLTSLEARHLLAEAGAAAADLAARVAAAPGAGYRPAATLNEVAAFCLRGEAPPADEAEHAAGACPLLDPGGRCACYPGRPFACRAMVSRARCRPGGAAEMDPFLVTVNLVLCQVIEHLDRGGVSGNLGDVVPYCHGAATEPPPGLLRNRPLPGLLVPPEERGRFTAFWRRLRRRPVGRGALGDFLPETAAA